MIDVNVGEIATSFRAMDGEQLLSPRLLNRIVAEVLRAMDERQAHRDRVNGERRTMVAGKDWESGESC